MRAAIWPRLGELEFAPDWPEPEPRPDRVLVEVAHCGLCGSDPHIIEGRMAIGPPPQVLGHEAAGTIVAVGERVRGWEVGERVAANLFGYCGACAWCLAGQPNHCRHKSFSAQSFAEIASYKPEQLFRLPAGMSTETGAFLEPTAACLHAVGVGAVAPGEHALVIGGGPMGQIIAQLCARAGAATVVLSDPRPLAREIAGKAGIEHVVDPGSEDLGALARATGERGGFDVVFEVAGAAAALEAAPSYAATGGRVVIVGVTPPDLRVPFGTFDIYEREIQIRGSFAAVREFPRALALLPQLNLAPLVTATVPLEDAAEAYASHKSGEQLKVLFAP
jgi:2-desacetyl-2-hydroxyethyl bacteriochlorophyllide A dehydrogenase